MSENSTVVVAMSGGVDSSTTAALLVERGYNVIGVMMRLWSEPHPHPPKGVRGEASNRCCSPEAVADARGVCQKLGIPFYLLNFEAGFKTHVVDFFIDGYARGITPNPCLQCNRTIKFGALLEKARALGADYLATGHYARVHERNGKFELLRGVDRQKDQSYALAFLSQGQLAHALFPLGEFTKEETREVARQFGLRVSEKAESQDLCFVADGNYRNFLRRNMPAALVPGDIVDTRGNVIGKHDGLANYTIGQRKGLGVAVGEPLYVIALDAVRHRVVVGRAEELGRRELVAGAVNWIAGESPPMPLRVTAKIRYKATEVPATLFFSKAGGQGSGRKRSPSVVLPERLLSQRRTLASRKRSPAVVLPERLLSQRRTLARGAREQVRVQFDAPLRDITPGQAVVFYDGEVCLGGGVIQATSQ